MSDHQLLTAAAHGSLRIRAERGAAYGDAVMSALIVPDEFRRVQDEYPIVFRQNAERDGFVALALLGFQSGENLYLEGGRWDARYRPLTMDIQPFLIGGSPDGTEAKQVVIDTASTRITADEGTRIFDQDGRPTPYLEQIIEKLGGLDVGYQASGAFFAALARHELLEPFVFAVTLDDGSTNRLVGFHVIDEERLGALDAAALGDLQSEGHLLPIFMAVASLGRLSGLVARKNRAARHG